MSEMRARLSNGRMITMYVPDEAEVGTEGIYEDSSDTHEGIFLPKRLIDDWYGGPLDPEGMDRLANAIYGTVFPRAVHSIADGIAALVELIKEG